MKPRDPNEALAALKDLESGPAPDVERAWLRFRHRRREAALAPPSPPWFRRPAWVALAAGAALVGALGFSPAARTATERVLLLFRVDQVTALPFNPADSPLANHDVSQMVGQLLRDEVTVGSNQPNQNAASAAQASQLAGFSVRYAPNWNVEAGAPSFQIRGGKDLQMTVDRARTQTVLDAAGLGAEQLPLSLDGATIRVHLPRAVEVMYGACGGWSAGDGVRPPLPPAGARCTVLAETPSPEVSLPPGLDVNQLASIELQMLGMNPAEADQYLRTIDWTSTLVVPFPSGEAESNAVPVDGVSGILLSRDRGSQGSHYVLLWSRQGMLYSIAGNGSASQGLELASELSH